MQYVEDMRIVNLQMGHVWDVPSQLMYNKKKLLSRGSVVDSPENEEYNAELQKENLLDTFVFVLCGFSIIYFI